MYPELHDPYIQGELDKDVQPCDYCSQPSKTIHIREVRLPDGIKPENTILIDSSTPVTEWPTVKHLGLTCGCYAKFHRQVAHIEDKMRERK